MHDFGVALTCGSHQCCHSVHVLLIRFRTGPHQRLDHVRMAQQGGSHQRCAVHVDVSKPASFDRRQDIFSVRSSLRGNPVQHCAQGIQVVSFYGVEQAFSNRARVSLRALRRRGCACSCRCGSRDDMGNGCPTRTDNGSRSRQDRLRSQHPARKQPISARAARPQYFDHSRMTCRLGQRQRCIASRILKVDVCGQRTAGEYGHHIRMAAHGCQHQGGHAGRGVDGGRVDQAGGHHAAKCAGIAFFSGGKNVRLCSAARFRWNAIKAGCLACSLRGNVLDRRETGCRRTIGQRQGCTLHVSISINEQI